MAESRQTKRPKNDYDTPGTLSTKLGFLSLPLETQKDIVKQVGSLATFYYPNQY